MNIVEIRTQQEQAIIQRTPQPAATAAPFTSMKQEFKCHLQLVVDSFDLDAGRRTRMAKDCTGGERTTGALKSKETATCLNNRVFGYEHGDGRLRDKLFGYERKERLGVRVRRPPIPCELEPDDATALDLHVRRGGGERHTVRADIQEGVLNFCAPYTVCPVVPSW